MNGRFQFSIRLLMAAVATVAAPLGVIVAKPSWQTGAATILVVLWMPAAFIAGVFYVRSWLRAFCVGAAIPAILAANVFALFAFLGSSNMRPESIKEVVLEFCNPDLRAPLTVFWMLIPVAGLFCVVARWLFAPSTSD